jgi:hypothetical protein
LKVAGVFERVIGISVVGNYHQARATIPATLTESDDLLCRTLILMEDSRTREKEKGDDQWTEFDRNFLWNIYYTEYFPT